MSCAAIMAIHLPGNITHVSGFSGDGWANRFSLWFHLIEDLRPPFPLQSTIRLPKKGPVRIPKMNQLESYQIAVVEDLCVPQKISLFVNGNRDKPAGDEIFQVPACFKGLLITQLVHFLGYPKDPSFHIIASYRFMHAIMTISITSHLALISVTIISCYRRETTPIPCSNSIFVS